MVQGILPFSESDILLNIMRLLPLLTSFSLISLSVPVATAKDRAETVLQRYQALQTITADPHVRYFSRGQIHQDARGLVWTTLTGKDIVVVERKQLKDRQSLGSFAISPDGDKLAYATTYLGQDLKSWQVVTLSAQPRVLLQQPVVNRMEDLRWNQESTGLYYSYWYPKEDVKKGLSPMVECRFRHVLTQVDKKVWDHGLAENFAIAEQANGELIAHRLLNPAAGIKTTFSMYRGQKNARGQFQFTSIYPRNQYVGFFLGLWQKQGLILSQEAGDYYGVVAVSSDGERRTLVPARHNEVLHTARLHQNTLILQYHNRHTQHVFLEQWNLKTGQRQRFALADLGLTPFGSLSNFHWGPGATRARASFADVALGHQTLELRLQTHKDTPAQLRVLAPEQPLDFNARHMKIERFAMLAKDGTPLNGYVFTRKDRPPTFGFIRHYAFISIKNAPEPREVQMVLEAGGAYLTLELPGGGEGGANWFLKGSRHRLTSVDYITEAAAHLRSQWQLPNERIAVLGRSWGGMTSLLLAARAGEQFGPIHAVVPVLDLKGVFENGWFGRISHSDFAPDIDRSGNYILDSAFWKRTYQLNPVEQLRYMSAQTQLRVFTNGLDDRIDQENLISRFMARTREQLAPGHFRHYDYNLAHHGSRDYQIDVIKGLLQDFDLTYRPMKR